MNIVSRSRIFFTAILLWSAAVCPPIAAMDFALRLLRKDGDVVDGVTLFDAGGSSLISTPVINDAGSMLWHAWDSTGQNNLFLDDRLAMGPTRPLNVEGIAYTNPAFARSSLVGTQGWVAFASSGSGFENAIVTSNGELLAMTPGTLNGMTLRSFPTGATRVDGNNNGDITFGAFFDDGDTRIPFVSLNDQVVVEGGDEVDGRTLELGHQQSGPLIPRINENGDLLFSALTAENGVSIFLNDQVLYEPGQVVGEFIVQGIGHLQHAFNNVGDVAWVADLQDSNGAGDPFVALLVNERIVVRSDFPFDGHMVTSPAFDIAINDQGNLLFRSMLDDGRQAVFTDAGLVAKAGDTIDGFTIPQDPWFMLTNSSLNNAGEFVFALNRDMVDPDASAALFRGTIPIPEPSTICLISLVGLFILQTRFRVGS